MNALQQENGLAAAMQNKNAATLDAASDKEDADAAPPKKTKNCFGIISQFEYQVFLQYFGRKHLTIVAPAQFERLNLKFRAISKYTGCS